MTEWIVSKPIEARAVFQSLALLSPSTIIPPLLDRPTVAPNTLTEPHRFHVVIQAMSATTGPLVRLYPVRALKLHYSLLPGIEVNDIWKCMDIFVLMSDLLEMMPVVDMSDGNMQARELRSDGGNNEEYLNDEEIAADAAINDTFLWMCVNSSPRILSVIFNKLTKYLAGKIVEPTMQEIGAVLPVEGALVLHPHPGEEHTGLDEGGEEGGQKKDEEFQFNLQLLSEVIGVKNVGVFRSRGRDILPWVEDICSVLDCTLSLGLKDEY